MSAHHPIRPLPESDRQIADRLVKHLLPTPFSPTMNFDEWMRKAAPYVRESGMPIPMSEEFNRLNLRGRNLMKEELKRALLIPLDLSQLLPSDRTAATVRQALIEGEAKQALSSYCTEVSNWLEQASAYLPAGLLDAPTEKAFTSKILSDAPRIISQDHTIAGMLTLSVQR